MECKIGLLLVIYFALCSAYPFDERLAVDEIKDDDLESNEMYFEQKLDHLDSKNKNTWHQRYWHNSSWYESNGGKIALLFIHNAYTISEVDTIDGNFLNPLAKDLNATRFYLEHRFYGKSKPKNDTSLDSLRYLSSEQALEDIAFFIKNIVNKHSYLVKDELKWVIFGISYGGSLATWARQKYPDLIYSAVAINAPLLAKADFDDYFQNVVKSINSSNSTCGNKITSASQELKELISKKELEKITKTFNLCNPMTENDDDVSILFSELAQNFAHAVDFNGITIKFKKPVSIQKLCEIMVMPDASPLELYARVNQLNLRNRRDSVRGCFDYRYNAMVEKFKKTDYDVAAYDKRQWIYQTCTEFGYFATSSKKSEMFGDNFPATLFAKQCQDLFGPEFTLEKIKDNVSKTNKKYGGLDLRVNGTIFVYYPENPWRNLFITQNKTDFYDVIVIDKSPYEQREDVESGKPNLRLWGFLKDLEKMIGCILNGAHECTRHPHHKNSK